MPPTRRSSFSPLLSCPWLNVFVYFGVCALLLGQILNRLHGHFSYAVDDAYIHLALAKRIAHGLYGINAGQPSSPASSILWPFLFVPFTGTGVLLYLPLAYNLLAGSCTAWLLGRVVQKQTAVAAGARTWRPQLLSILLLFALNLFGLTFLGLEHPLEVLLAVSAAYGLLFLLDGESPPRWTLAAAAIVPCVRYEGLLITGAVTLALLLIGRWKSAVLLMAVGIAPLVAFAAFLRHLGLPAAPMSVLMKSPTAYLGGPRTPVLLRLAKQSFLLHLHDPERFTILLLAATLAWLTTGYRRRRRMRAVAAAGTAACAVHMLVGPYGWFYRYEIYCLSFALVLAVAFGLRDWGSAPDSLLGEDEEERAAAPQMPGLQVAVPGAMLVAVAALALFYFTSLAGIVNASSAIEEQQAQLGRFTHDFYHGPVAVHDLGWVGVGRTPREYILDLAGLGSYDAFQLQKSGNLNAGAVAALAARDRVQLAIINPQWFGSAVPTTWRPLAKLCARDPATDFSLVSDRVVFYVTPLGDPATLMASLVAFQATLPPDIPFELNPTSTTSACWPKTSVR